MKRLAWGIIGIVLKILDMIDKAEKGTVRRILKDSGEVISALAMVAGKVVVLLAIIAMLGTLML
jgi:hypothetical protein